MAKSRDIEVFGLSFMDLISCGLGGMLVLMFVFSTLVNAEGVAAPSKAERNGKSLAQLERDLLFNTHFVLKVTLASGSTRVVPEVPDHIFQSRGIQEVGGMYAHIFMVNQSSRILRKIRFSLQGGPVQGTVELFGTPPVTLETETNIIEVIKEETRYRLKLREQ